MGGRWMRVSLLTLSVQSFLEKYLLGFSTSRSGEMLSTATARLRFTVHYLISPQRSLTAALTCR
jgi:hypothetical protein